MKELLLIDDHAAFEELFPVFDASGKLYYFPTLNNLVSALHFLLCFWRRSKRRMDPEILEEIDD